MTLLRLPSPAMQAVYRSLDPLAAGYRGERPGRNWRNKIALIRGESGVGKTVVARYLATEAGADPFVRVNIGALTESLIESELFGHARGAFTGASAEKRGFIARAGRGMLFLDEIGSLPEHLQSKLLHVLSERWYLPVGATREEKVECLFVAATWENLERRVEEGTFREDLFYRLNGWPVEVPPLRERSEDVAALANYFAKGAAIEPAALQVLADHKWGRSNIRGLENTVMRVLGIHQALTYEGVLSVLSETDSDDAVAPEHYERIALDIATQVDFVRPASLADRCGITPRWASEILRRMADEKNLLRRKGRGRATHYVIMNNHDSIHESSGSGNNSTVATTDDSDNRGGGDEAA